ncbi:MAG: putative sulfate exporter family transporter [Alteraurantiacibacter sp.]
MTIQNPFPQISRWIARQLLQFCVVLLGFGMDLAIVLRAGKTGALFAAISIGTTLILGYWFGKWLKIPVKASVLISAGTAICGGSAIAAVATVVGAAEQEISIAMGTVFLLNAAALYIFPLLGHSLHLSPDQFGTWAGIAIHDISSVVGAASYFDAASLDVATAVKLSRALWIVPISLLFAFLFQRQTAQLQYQQTRRTTRRTKVHIPWFIGLFLLASLMRTFVPNVAHWSPVLTQFSEAGLKLTLFLIGTGLSLQALKAVGWRPIAQGIVLWVVISISSLGMILWLVH